VQELDGRRIARISVSPAPQAEAGADDVPAESTSG
jgi:hypothetical protein